MSVPNLTREDAGVRAARLSVESYEISLDLTDGGGKPAERSFRSTTTIRFSVREAGTSTFVDLVADAVRSVTLNGTALEIGEYDAERGIVLADLQVDNVAVIDADMLFTNTGEGLHRFVDPLDGEVYLYSQFETADAKRVFACFDQPDLKAAITWRALVPEPWEVISNSVVAGVEDHGAAKLVSFAPTKRLSPYVSAIVAGPYSGVRDHHDGIDLGIWCRRSLARHLDADEIFEVTKQGFDWYHANFGMRYPFGKYDQLIVPEFNAGAMENVGCVTFNEMYIFRSKVTDSRRERRAETILHEMAHMWFGDLVTMRWWDDLWLNESFATYAAVLAQTGGTRWTNAWTTFANVEKTWAYRQDQLPSTHPISTDAPDVQTAEVNFDGITYAKGASVLKQLSAYVGLDSFLAGLRAYFAEHAYGNTSLADLLSALEKSSGRDLGHWSKLWLETTGINSMTPEFTLDESGHYASFELVQGSPTEVATSNTTRPHRLAIGLYHDETADGVTRLVRTGRVELDVTDERTVVEELIGVSQPDVLLVNDDDLTYCKLRLDERSLRTLAGGGIARLTESLPRALCWSATWQMTRDGDLATRDYLAMILAGSDEESDIGLLQSHNRQMLRSLEIYADQDWAPEGYRQLGDKALAALRAAEPGSDHQLAWVHALIGAARTPEHIAVVRGLFRGEDSIAGLAIDDELRWSMLTALTALGVTGEDDIVAELERDPSSAGQRHAATCRALIPTAEAKTRTWQRAFEDTDIPNAELAALVAGFSSPTQGELVAPYVQRYFDDIEGLWSRRTSEVAQTVVIGLFPTWASTIDPATVAAADEFLARPGIPTALRRLVSEGRADVVRALRARDADRAAGSR